MRAEFILPPGISITIPSGLAMVSAEVRLKRVLLANNEGF